MKRCLLDDLASQRCALIGWVIVGGDNNLVTAAKRALDVGNNASNIPSGRELERDVLPVPWQIGQVPRLIAILLVNRDLLRGLFQLIQMPSRCGNDIFDRLRTQIRHP